jgi:hypothetical protein
MTTRRKPIPEVVVGVALRNDEGEIWSSCEFRLHIDLLDDATGIAFEPGFVTNKRPFVDRETAYALQFPKRRRRQRYRPALHMTEIFNALRKPRRSKP